MFIFVRCLQQRLDTTNHSTPIMENPFGKYRGIDYSDILKAFSSKKNFYSEFYTKKASFHFCKLWPYLQLHRKMQKGVAAEEKTKKKLP